MKKTIKTFPVSPWVLIFHLLFLSGAPAAFSSSNEKEIFIVAQRAFEDGFYDVSLRYINQLFSEFPGTDKQVEARLLEGQCYFFKKQYLKAFSIFRETASRDAYKDASLFWLGETYLKTSDYKQAQEQYQKVIEAFPASLYAPQAYYSLAWSYFEKGDYELAKKFFLDLIDKFPSNNLSEDGAFKIGECDYNSGQYEGAIFGFTHYMKEYPNSSRNFEAAFNIAESYYYLEQYESAVTYYKKAMDIAKNPQNTLNAMVAQAWSLLKLSKFNEAQKTVEEALALARSNNLDEQDVLLAQASLYLVQEKPQQAIGAYSELIDRFPAGSRAVDSYLGRANLYYAQNEYARAVSDYEKVIESCSSGKQCLKVLEKARFGLGWTFLKSGDVSRAIDSFQRVFDEADSKSVKVSALTQIGDAYLDVGKLEKAVEVYDRILKDLPDTPYSDYVQYRLGLALLKSQRIDPALLAFQSLRTNYPKSRFIPDSDYYLGVAYYSKKDWGAAVQVLEPLVKGMPQESDFASEARYILGLSLFYSRQFSRAEAVFDEIIRLFPAQEAMIANARLGIAKIYYEQGKTKEALALLSEIVFKYPHSDAALEALFWEGQHAMSSGLYRRAIDYFTQILNDFPSTDKVSLVNFELGRAYHAEGVLDKALEHYRLVAAQSGEDLSAKAKLAIADIFSTELDPAKAVETYQSIITRSPEFKRDALMKIARIYRKNKLYKEEIEAYQNALQSPKGSGEVTNAGIQFAIGDTYEIINEADKAVETYFKIPYLYEKEQAWVVKAYWRIAKIYENKEDWEKAVAVYSKIVDYNIDESRVAAERIAAIEDDLKKSN
jgi:tetratricopeptide (TPR) repeat protein